MAGYSERIIILFESKYTRVVLCLFLCLMFFSPVPSSYGSWVEIPPDLDDMVEHAELILIGNVTYITPFEPGGIYRDVTLDVEECLKGAHNSSKVEIRIFGGESYWSSIPDANFTVGERVLVFLHEKNGNLRVFNYGFGKYLVIKGASYPLLQVKKILGIVDTSKVARAQDPPADVDVRDYGSERARANLLIFGIFVLIFGGAYVAINSTGQKMRVIGDS